MAIADLPVKPRQRIGKPRVGGRPVHDNSIVGVDVDAGEKLIEIDFEVGSDRADDMAFEQQRQGQAGDRQRDDDGHRTAGDKPQPQRVPHHPVVSGTR